MESVEISGKTVAEAIARAEEQFGVSRDQLKITVLKEAKQGILGLGSGEAKIKVEPLVSVTVPKSEGQDIAETAKDLLQELLSQLDIKATVTPVPTEPSGDEETDRIHLSFDIKGDDDVGILIGRHGQTLASLQYLLRVMLAQKTKTWAAVVLDVDGYKQRRAESLRATVERLAEQVKSRKMPFTLEPMPAYERRIIHLALADNPDVTTQSVGEGEFRKVVIIPRGKEKPG